jgi:hypothetical protein
VGGFVRAESPSGDDGKKVATVGSRVVGGSGTAEGDCDGKKVPALGGSVGRPVMTEGEGDGEKVATVGRRVVGSSVMTEGASEGNGVSSDGVAVDDHGMLVAAEARQSKGASPAFEVNTNAYLCCERGRL